MDVGVLTATSAAACLTITRARLGLQHGSKAGVRSRSMLRPGSHLTIHFRPPRRGDSSLVSEDRRTFLDRSTRSSNRAGARGRSSGRPDSSRTARCRRTSRRASTPASARRHRDPGAGEWRGHGWIMPGAQAARGHLWGLVGPGSFFSRRTQAFRESGGQTFARLTRPEEFMAVVEVIGIVGHDLLLGRQGGVE